MGVKYCEYCRRYILDIFMPYHNKQHKYMILKLDEKASVLEDLE